METKYKNPPAIRSQFFWDTDFDEIKWEKAYLSVIARIIERGGQHEINEIIKFYGREKVVKAIRDKIYFLPNYAIDRAIEFFPELKREEMYCYINRKNKDYHWI